MSSSIYRAVNTTLIYIECGGEYLMLHRTKKENDCNRDKWIGIGGKFASRSFFLIHASSPSSQFLSAPTSPAVSRRRVCPANGGASVSSQRVAVIPCALSASAVTPSPAIRRREKVPS